MSGETEAQESGWTVDTLKYLLDERKAWQARFEEERDRRNSEGVALRAEALTIKASGETEARNLARENQVLKEAQHNGTLELLKSSSSSYATKDDLATLGERFTEALEPLKDFVRGQQGQRVGGDRIIAYLIAAGSLVYAFATHGH